MYGHQLNCTFIWITTLQIQAITALWYPQLSTMIAQDSRELNISFLSEWIKGKPGFSHAAPPSKAILWFLCLFLQC